MLISHPLPFFGLNASGNFARANETESEAMAPDLEYYRRIWAICDCIDEIGWQTLEGVDLRRAGFTSSEIARSMNALFARGVLNDEYFLEAHWRRALDEVPKGLEYRLRIVERVVALGWARPGVTVAGSGRS